MTLKDTKFGFLAHFKGIETVSNVPALAPLFAGLPKESIEAGLLEVPPFIAAHPRGLTPNGYAVHGEFALVPLTAEHILRLAENSELSTVLEKIVLGVNLLADSGVGIVGLGAMTGSALTANGRLLEKRVKVPLTSGNSFASLATIMSVEKVTELLNLDLSDLTVSVVGATGSVGAAVCYELSRKAKQVVAVARHTGRLNRLQEKVGSKLIPSTDIIDACQTDIMVVTTASSESLVTAEMPKSGQVIIDETQPRNCSIELLSRPDVLVVDGALISVPGIDLGIDMACPPKTIYGCYAETMMLSLDGTHDHTWVGHVDPECFPLLRELAIKYGLDLAPIYSFDQPLTPERLDQFIQAAKCSSYRKLAMVG